MKTKKNYKAGGILSKKSIKCYRPSNRDRFETERKIKFKLLGDDKDNYSIKDGTLIRDLDYVGTGTFSNLCNITSVVEPDIPKIIRVSKKDETINKKEINEIYLQQNKIMELQKKPLFDKITPKIYSNKISSRRWSNEIYTYSIIEKYRDLYDLHIGFLEDPDICKQVFFIVYMLHNNGIYHRDLKNNNLVYKKENGNRKVGVIDFDKMKTNENMIITEDEAITGTPSHLPPFEVFYYLPIEEDLTESLRRKSQTFLLKLIDMYSTMAIMFIEYEDFSVARNLEEFREGVFNHNVMLSNIPFLESIKKHIKKTDPNKIFKLKLLDIYINLINILSDIVNTGQRTRQDSMDWLRHIDQEKITDFESQIDELYELIGHEMYSLYELTPPEGLVPQPDEKIEILVTLMGKDTKSVTIKFPFILNGSKKDTPENIAKELVHVKLIHSKNEKTFKNKISDLLKNPKKYDKGEINSFNKSRTNSKFKYDSFKLQII